MEGSQPLDRHPPSPLVAGIQSKPKFPFHQLASLLAFEQRSAGPHFPLECTLEQMSKQTEVLRTWVLPVGESRSLCEISKDKEEPWGVLVLELPMSSWCFKKTHISYLCPLRVSISAHTHTHINTNTQIDVVMYEYSCRWINKLINTEQKKSYWNKMLTVGEPR